MQVSIAITKSIFEAFTKDVKRYKESIEILSRYFNIDESDFRWQSRPRTASINATPEAKLERLMTDLESLPGQTTRGHKAAARTIRTFLGAKDHTGTKPAKDVKQFTMMLINYLATQPHQRVYIEENGQWRAYQVTDVTYVPPERTMWGTYPPYCKLTLAYRMFGRIHTTTTCVHEEHCKGHTPIDGLTASGIFLETEELREAYLEEYERFVFLADRVGYQCWARGQATDDLDGNPPRKGWWWTHNVITLDPQGEPSRVVIDLFTEDPSKEEYGRRYHGSNNVDLTFWRKQRKAMGLAEADVTSDEAEEEDEEKEEQGIVEVPTYPMLAVFDLRRHLRLKVHVSQLEDYKWDAGLGERLILPSDVRDLLSVLLTQKQMFQDVIAGKGGGIIVLCAGPPGTGKTLTAEVYSEVMRRPLYSVQTAQLGTTAQELEDELRKVFARAQRWGAILLLDEADVYVRARGDDLDQNAIVGVFLRVLEYYQGVMFMTTNRVDDLDDAIASRCIARIDYKIPHPEDQKRIWRVLAQTAEVELPDEEIDRIVEVHSELSGRDIKNLLKLARMISLFRKKPVDSEMIDFVKRFKPTGPAVEYEQQEGGGLILPTTDKRAPRDL